MNIKAYISKFTLLSAGLLMLFVIFTNNSWGRLSHAGDSSIVLLDANELPHGKDTRIVVGGTGDSQVLLRKIAEVLEQRHPGTHIDVPDSIGSSGGIKAVRAGKIDLARVARALKQEEQDPDLTYVLFAESPVVCVVHPSVTGIESVTNEQIVAIYTGRITDWAQLGSSPGKIYPIAREPGDSSFGVLKQYIPGFKDIKEPVAKVIYTTPETFATLVKYPGTIGFIPLSAIRGTHLRILKINGIFPSKESVYDGTYRLLVPLGIVYKGTLAGLRKTFVDYLTSAEARILLESMGTYPVRSSETAGMQEKEDTGGPS